MDIRITEAGLNHRLVFSGDIGRTGLPIIRDPDPPSGPVDTLIIESTYADREPRGRQPTPSSGWAKWSGG